VTFSNFVHCHRSANSQVVYFITKSSTNGHFLKFSELKIYNESEAYNKSEAGSN